MGMRDAGGRARWTDGERAANNLAFMYRLVRLQPSMLRYYYTGNWNVTTPCKKIGGTGALSWHQPFNTIDRIAHAPRPTHLLRHLKV
jgi:hypothetical protein